MIHSQSSWPTTTVSWAFKWYGQHRTYGVMSSAAPFTARKVFTERISEVRKSGWSSEWRGKSPQASMLFILLSQNHWPAPLDQFSAAFSSVKDSHVEVKSSDPGISWWLGLHTSIAGSTLEPWLGELRSCKPRSCQKKAQDPESPSLGSNPSSSPR